MGAKGFFSFLNSSGTTHGLFCCQAEYRSTMQIRTSTEAKRILRVLRLSSALVDMAARKFSHKGLNNESKPDGGSRAVFPVIIGDGPDEVSVDLMTGAN